MDKKPKDLIYFDEAVEFPKHIKAMEDKIKAVIEELERLCPTPTSEWTDGRFRITAWVEAFPKRWELYIKHRGGSWLPFATLDSGSNFDNEYSLYFLEMFYLALGLGVQSPAPDEKDAEIADLKAANDALQGVHEGDLKALEALRELKSLAPIAGKDHKIAGLEQEIANLNAQRTRLCALISMDSEKTSKLIEALEWAVKTAEERGYSDTVPYSFVTVVKTAIEDWKGGGGMAEKVSKKIMKRIEDALRIRLDDVEEFESLHKVDLFDCPPDGWSDYEKAICDYQNRIESGMIQKVREILGFNKNPTKQPPSED